MIKKYLIAWIELAGIVSACIGFSSIVGHITKAEQFYKWNTDASSVGMALNTAIAVWIIGVAIFFIGIIMKQEK